MIQISEILPDPLGKDTEGEWIELWNNGSETTLSGWTIKTSGKSKYILSGEIKEGERKVFKRAVTKLTLKNENDSVYLYAPSGKLMDEVNYPFPATEGKSLVRFGDKLVLGEPTPGKVNQEVFTAQLISSDIPFGKVSRGDASGFGSGLGLALLMALGILFLIKTNEDLSNIFFRRDEGTGKSSGF